MFIWSSFHQAFPPFSAFRCWFPVQCSLLAVFILDCGLQSVSIYSFYQSLLCPLFLFSDYFWTIMGIVRSQSLILYKLSYYRNLILQLCFYFHTKSYIDSIHLYLTISSSSSFIFRLLCHQVIFLLGEKAPQISILNKRNTQPFFLWYNATLSSSLF